MKHMKVFRLSTLMKVIYPLLFVILFFFNVVILEKGDGDSWLQNINIGLTSNNVYALERYPGGIQVGNCGYGACSGTMQYCMACKTDPWANECNLFNEICFNS